MTGRFSAQMQTAVAWWMWDTWRCGPLRGGTELVPAQRGGERARVITFRLPCATVWLRTDHEPL